MVKLLPNTISEGFMFEFVSFEAFAQFLFERVCTQSLFLELPQAWRGGG